MSVATSTTIRIRSAQPVRGASVYITQQADAFIVEHDYGVSDFVEFKSYSEAVQEAARIFAQGNVATILDSVEQRAFEADAERTRVAGRLSSALEENGIQCPCDGEFEIVVRAAA